MTCIVGVVERQAVFIGGDSAGVAGHTLQIRADAKVFSREEHGDRWAFGFTTSFRMGQLIRYRLSLPKAGPAEDLAEFMATEFVDALRTCLKRGGWAYKENDRESAGTFLVGVRGRLFVLESDYQVAETTDGYAAVGCGADLALGALHASDQGVPAYNRVLRALEAAEHHSAGVAAPFMVVVT